MPIAGTNDHRKGFFLGGGEDEEFIRATNLYKVDPLRLLEMDGPPILPWSGPYNLYLEKNLKFNN